MPKRRRARAQNRACYIAAERRQNQRVRLRNVDERLGLFPLHDASLDGAQLRGCFVLRPRAPCTCTGESPVTPWPAGNPAVATRNGGEFFNSHCDFGFIRYAQAKNPLFAVISTLDRPRLATSRN
jgi:hypothetical protein